MKRLFDGLVGGTMLIMAALIALFIAVLLIKISGVLFVFITIIALFMLFIHLTR